MLELDCHMTKDRQTVVHHDFTLSRTTGHEGFIKDLNYDVRHHLHRIRSIQFVLLSILAITEDKSICSALLQSK